MAVTYSYSFQGRTVSVGTGVPTHSAVAGDTYSDLTSGLQYTYTTSWVPVSTPSNWTEAVNTSAPNATVPVTSFTATNAATDVDASVVPKGTGAFSLNIADNAVAGGNKRGIYAVDLQLKRAEANAVAGANYSCLLGGLNSKALGGFSLAGGYYSIATGSYSVALGYIGTATGDNSVGITATGINGGVGIGGSSSASGPGSVAMGNICIAQVGASMAIGEDNYANAYASVATGYRSRAWGIIGRVCHSSAIYAVQGDSQIAMYPLMARTTGNTATPLTSNKLAASTDNQLILQNNGAATFSGIIVGKKSGTTDCVSWKIEGLIVRGANAASTVLKTGTVTVIDNTPAWGTPTLVADTTNGGLTVNVIGNAATDIQWMCRLESAELFYA